MSVPRAFVLLPDMLYPGERVRLISVLLSCSLLTKHIVQVLVRLWMDSHWSFIFPSGVATFGHHLFV